MKIEMDDKEFSKELAEIAYRSLYQHIKDDSKDHWYMWYDKDIADAVQQNIDKLFEENKEKIFNAIVDKCAEKYHEDIKLQVILSAMMGSKD